MIINHPKVITGMVRFTYANVWEPKSINGGEEKYTVQLIVPKLDLETVVNIRKAIYKAKKIGEEKLQGVLENELKFPLKDGDSEAYQGEEYKHCYVINATTNIPPGIVNKDNDPISDRSQVYSGAYGRASIVFYAYNVVGNAGIGCGLNHLQKLKDGEHLIARGTPEEDFSQPFEELPF